MTLPYRRSSDASFDTLLRASRKDELEAAQKQQLDEATAPLLPLILALARLAARQAVAEAAHR